MVSIEVQDRGFLDLSKEFTVPLTLSVSDIGQLGSSQGGFSTNITIPKSETNNKILDYIFDLSYDSKFRNKNIPSNLWQNGTLIKKGFLKVSAISDSIRATFFTDNVDWFDQIRGRKLSDIVFPDEYNFIWNATNVTNGATRTEGYLFHLSSPNFNNDASNELLSIVDQSRPATYVHSVFEYIFKNRGIKIEGDLLKDPMYYRAILPFNKSKFTLGNRALTSSQARVYLYAPSKFITITDQSDITDASFYTGMNWGDAANPNGTPNKYNGTIWNNTTKTYTAPFSGKYLIRLNVAQNFSNLNSFNNTVTQYINYYNVIINGSDNIYPRRDNYTYGEGDCFEGIKTNADNTGAFSSNYSNDPIEVQLNLGDTVQLEVAHTYLPIPPANVGCGNPELNDLDTTFEYSELEIYPSTYSETGEDIEYSLNDGVDLASSLPDITQDEFLKFIFNAFGIVPQYDIFSNTLYLNKYDFLEKNKSNAENWSSKIDYTKTSQFTFDSIKKYGKQSFFKYKSTSDDSLLKEYEEINNVPYGSGYIDIDNDFIPNEKTVYTAPFSGTMIKDGVIHLPNADSTPRICLSSPQIIPDLTIDGNDFLAKRIYFDTSQPIADGGNNYQSICFGMPEGYNGADTSLIKNYYQLKTRLLNNPTLIRVNLLLTELDILNLDFQKPKVLNIGGKDLYFILNKIKQYKGDGSSTECELLLML